MQIHFILLIAGGLEPAESSQSLAESIPLEFFQKRRALPELRNDKYSRLMINMIFIELSGPDSRGGAPKTEWFKKTEQLVTKRERGKKTSYVRARTVNGSNLFRAHK